MPDDRVWTARDKAMILANGDLVGEESPECAVAGQPKETTAHREHAANQEGRANTDMQGCAAGRIATVQDGQCVRRSGVRETYGEDGEDLAQHDGTHCDL